MKTQAQLTSDGDLAPGAEQHLAELVRACRSADARSRLAAAEALCGLLDLPSAAIRVRPALADLRAGELARQEADPQAQSGLIELAARLSDTKAEHVAYVVERDWIERLGAALAHADARAILLADARAHHRHVALTRTVCLSTSTHERLSAAFADFPALRALLPGVGSAVRTRPFGELCFDAGMPKRLVELRAPRELVEVEAASLRDLLLQSQPGADLPEPESHAPIDDADFVLMTIAWLCYGRDRVDQGKAFERSDTARRFLAHFERADAIGSATCYELNPLRSFWLNERVTLPRSLGVCVGVNGGPLSYAFAEDSLPAGYAPARRLAADEALLSFVWLQAQANAWSYLDEAID